VDTFLTLDVDGVTRTGSDRQRDDLSPEIVLHVCGVDDGAGPVTVTDQGQYGPDKWYRICAEEVVPTPTAMATNTPAPTNTDTPAPASTHTSTPNLHDMCEADDIDPRLAAVGETQRHNFHPDGDVDKIRLRPKAGRDHCVFTSKLTVREWTPS
jgi:hypothetical protein